jgi:hypothetical protein
VAIAPYVVPEYLHKIVNTALNIASNRAIPSTGASRKKLFWAVTNLLESGLLLFRIFETIAKPVTQPEKGVAE